MNILFDLFTPQHFTGGAGEYIRRVFYSLLETIEDSQLDVSVVGLLDSSLGRYAYSDLAPEALKAKGVSVADIAGTNLKNIIATYSIDRVFIGAAQYWGARFDVENITCPVVCVIHDLCDEEVNSTCLKTMENCGNMWQTARGRLSKIVHSLLRHKMGINRMKPMVGMIRRNSNVDVVTISQFSLRSIEYHLGLKSSQTHVLYSPERISPPLENPHDIHVRELIESGRKYYLMLTANRWLKNAERAINAFNKYVELTGGEEYFVTLGYPVSTSEHHIVMPYLQASDLSLLMKHCYALVFPSFFEGFGYPPVEAMKYGKPVLASNVTSIPEVLGDAAIYFSPFYESDIYKAFCSLRSDNYEYYSHKARERYDIVSARQADDLKKLIKLILCQE